MPTLKRAKEHPDQTVATKYGSQRVLAGNAIDTMTTVNADLKILTIKPGQTTSHHYHLHRQSLFFIMEGCVQFTSAFLQESMILEKGDTLILQPGEDHAFNNVGQSLATVLEVGSPAHYREDKIYWHEPVRKCVRHASNFWDKGEHLKLKICGVDSLEMAYNCQKMGVDAIGIHLLGHHWHHRLNHLDWLDWIPTTLSVFLVTDLREAAVVCALLSKLQCDTLQMDGVRTIEDLKALADPVRSHGFKVALTLPIPTANELAPTVRWLHAAAPWLDGLVWVPPRETSRAKNSFVGVEPTVAIDLIQAIDLPCLISGGLFDQAMGNPIGHSALIGVSADTEVAWQVAIDEKQRTIKSMEKIAALKKRTTSFQAR